VLRLDQFENVIWDPRHQRVRALQLIISFLDGLYVHKESLILRRS